MERNIGKTDRLIRIILSIALIIIGLIYNIWISVIGVIILFTAIIRFCSIYDLFGISTSERDIPIRRNR